MKPQRPALFLDRDGVVNYDFGYVHHIRDFHFRHGIFELCHRFQDAGYLLVLVTNQSGIGRGYFSLAQYQQLMTYVMSAFRFAGIDFAATYVCPHHPQQGCLCRKPLPTMLHQASYEHGIALTQSVMIGDKASDMAAGDAAGLAKLHWLEGPSTDKCAVASFADIKPE